MYNDSLNLRSWAAVNNNSKEAQALAGKDGGNMESLLDRYAINFEDKEHLYYAIECLIFIVFFVAIFMRIYVQNCCCLYKENEQREMPII